MTSSPRNEPTGCGCNPGYYLCSTAISLWGAVGMAYDAAWETGDWEAYERARAVYGDHGPQLDTPPEEATLEELGLGAYV